MSKYCLKMLTTASRVHVTLMGMSLVLHVFGNKPKVELDQISELIRSNKGKIGSSRF